MGHNQSYNLNVTNFCDVRRKGGITVPISKTILKLEASCSNSSLFHLYDASVHVVFVSILNRLCQCRKRELKPALFRLCRLMAGS